MADSKVFPISINSFVTNSYLAYTFAAKLWYQKFKCQ